MSPRRLGPPPRSSRLAVNTTCLSTSCAQHQRADHTTRNNPDLVQDIGRLRERRQVSSQLHIFIFCIELLPEALVLASR